MTPKITHMKDVCGGKACIEGTRIRVIDIIERYKFLKEQPEDIAADFGIPVKAVFAALSYYYEHSQEIKKEIDTDKAFVQKLKNNMKCVAYAT